MTTRGLYTVALRIALASVFASAFVTQATGQSLPAGWTSRDIGTPAVAGSTQHSSGTYTLKGAGDVAGTADALQFAYRQITGDATIHARVVSIERVQSWSKAGVMIRESLAANAAMGMVFVSGSSRIAFHQRLTAGASRTSTNGANASAPYWVRLERRGTLLTASQSSNGVTWTTVGTMTLAAPTIYVGLGVASADTNRLATGVIDNVAVTPPVANQPPAVTLTGPADGATFTAPATVSLTATASDTDGTISTVEFYAGTTLIGSDTTAPYSVTWNNVPAGGYVLTAVAKDNLGATTSSAARSVTVSAGLPPSLTATDIGGPLLAGSTQYSGGTYTLKGAGEVGGTADSFQFAYRQMTGDATVRARVVSVQTVNPWSKAGVMIRESLAANAAMGMMFISGSSGSAFHQRVTAGASRTTTTGTAVSAPYWVQLDRRGTLLTASQSSDGATWVTIGTMSLSAPTVYVGLAVASADANQLATGVLDNVAITVPAANQPPAISLTSPASGATFTAPASIALAATASDTDGTIARVDFYAGTTLVGSDTSSPYSYTWSGVAAGSYSLTAVARDNGGAATTSAARSVTVSPGTTNQAPVISMTAPAAGAIYTAPASVSVAATASDTDGSITRVDFYAGSVLIGSDTTSPYSMTWSNVTVGSYSLTAVARDNAGAMTVSGARDIRVDDAAMPRTAIFTASTNHTTSVDRYFLEIFPAGATPAVANPVATRDLGKPAVVNGECTVDVSSTTVALAPGSYIATVTAIGSGGSARSAASPAFVR